MATVEELEGSLGARVRALRLARSLSQVELAELANVSTGALKHLESGAGANITTLVKVLRALDAQGWIDTLAPAPVPFNPLAVLEQRERELARGSRQRRVRRKKVEHG